MMHTSQDAKDNEINILQKVSQFNYNACRHLEAMLCVVMYNYKTSNPHCMHKFQNLPSCNHYHCYIFALTGLAILGWTDQSSTLLTWELSSLNVYPFLVYNREPYAALPSSMLGFGACQVFVLSRLT